MPFGTAGGLAPTPSAIGKGTSAGTSAGKGGAPSFSPKAAGAFSGTGRDAPIGTTSSQGAGPKGGATEGLSQEMVLQHQVADIVGDTPEKRADLTPRTVKNAFNDPRGFLTKKNSFGYTMAQELAFARREGFRDIDQQGEYGRSFASFDGLLPHQPDNTPKYDRSVAANPEIGKVMQAFVSFSLPNPLGSIVSTAMDPEGFSDRVGTIFNTLGLVKPKSPTSPTSTTTPTKSTTTPVSVDIPKAKPQPLPKPPQQEPVGPGPRLTIPKEEEKKKGGRIKRKKNYAKGGGVRSAKY